MKNEKFTVPLPEHVIDAFSKIAEAQHMRPTFFAALCLSKLSDLKAEHALDALTAIPKEYFKGRPGRPSKEEASLIA
jgi:hypothetical protein